MSDTYVLPELRNNRRFHYLTEGFVMGLGSFVALAGLLGLARPGFHELQDVADLAHPLDVAQTTTDHNEAWYLDATGTGGLLLLDGLGMFAVGRRHRDHRELHEDIGGMLGLESLLDADSSFDDPGDQS